MPYGLQSTAALAGGSPRRVASASAARRASYAFAYSGLRTIGPAGGGASFGSTPRPAPIGAQAPLRFGGLVDCARTVRPAPCDATRAAAAITTSICVKRVMVVVQPRHRGPRR